MTQQHYIEQVTGQYPEVAEPLVREMLNEAADAFVEETRILSDTLDLTPAAALSHALSDRVARIRRVTLDGVEVKPFSPHLVGKGIWRVVDGGVLEVGTFYTDGLEELSGTTVTAHYDALPTPFTDNNLDAESDLPKQYQSVLTLRVMERLELMRETPNLDRTRALFAQYTAMKRRAMRGANSGREGGVIRPQMPSI